MIRECLRCEKPFDSDNAFIRTCASCKKGAMGHKKKDSRNSSRSFYDLGLTDRSNKAKRRVADHEASKKNIRN